MISAAPVAFSSSVTPRKLGSPLAASSVRELVAAQQVEERHEDRQLEEQRHAGGERVDLVLLVERHHLPLLALAVVLVLLLDLLDLRLVRLQRAHRADLLQRQRQDRQPGDDRQQDDRDPPADPDVVVEEGEDRVGDVDQRLEDALDAGDGEHQAVASVVRGSPGSKQRARLDGVVAAVAERVAAREAPGGQDRAADDARARGSPARRRPSRWARTCSGAGAPARSSAGRGGSGRGRSRAAARFTCYGSKLDGSARQPGLCGQLLERGRDPAGTLALDQAGDVGTRDEHEVVATREARRPATRRPLSAPASRHFSLRRRRPCGSPRRRGEPRRDRRPAAARERVEDQEAVGVRAALPVDAVEVAAARQATAPAPLARRPRSRRQPLATLAAPALDDLAAAARAHAGAEPVGPGALALLGLVGPLHDRRGSIGPPRGSTEVAKRQRSDLSSRNAGSGGEPPRNAATLASMIARRALGSALRRSGLDLGAGPGGARASLPASTFQLWIEPLRPVSAQAGTLYLAAPATTRAWVERRYRGVARKRRFGTPCPSSSGSTSSRKGSAAAGAGGAGWTTARRVAGARSDPHLRALRDRRRQPPRPRRGAGGRRAPRRGVQPALPSRPARARQDAPAGRDRRLPAPPAPGADRPLHDRGAVHDRVRRRPSQGRAGALQAALPRARRAADRRRPGARGQGAHAGGVRPHVQRASRRGEADRPLERPPARGARAARGAPPRPLRAGASASSSGRPTCAPEPRSVAHGRRGHRWTCPTPPRFARSPARRPGTSAGSRER